MDPNAFRSDLLRATLARNWYAETEPALVAGWQPAANVFTTQLAAHAQVHLPELAYLFAAEAPMARQMIERWRLRDVLLLGAGLPTPLSPLPQQVMHYADSSPDVVDEAVKAGYTAHVADVRSPEDLVLLADADSAVAVGLLHFLSDALVSALLNGLGRVGFQRLAFDQVTRSEAATLAAHWSQLGIALYPRTPDEVAALLQPLWCVTQVQPLSAFYAGHPVFESLFAADASDLRVYRVEAVR